MAGYALIIVDMIKDNVNTAGHGQMDLEAKKIVPSILDLAKTFRRCGQKVVFACDSFMPDDFMFGGRMPPHAIRGTGGDEPIADLEMQPTDLLLPKRRMSAFYKTDLDQTLRTWGVDTVAVCGIVTNVCVSAHGSGRYSERFSVGDSFRRVCLPQTSLTRNDARPVRQIHTCPSFPHNDCFGNNGGTGTVSSGRNCRRR